MIQNGGVESPSPRPRIHQTHPHDTPHFHSTLSERKLRRFNFVILVFRAAAFSFALSAAVFMVANKTASPRWYDFGAFRLLHLPTQYENPKEAFPEDPDFIDRTSSVGKVIGWVPQTAVLWHSSIGGFVSHCGWNSILESMWFGVPVAAWPLFAEQQLNAFKLVVDLGIAMEIKMDHRSNLHRLPGSSEKDMIVRSEEIEGAIRRLRSDGEKRKKTKEMKEKSRLAVSEDGFSYGTFY